MCPETLQARMDIRYSPHQCLCFGFPIFFVPLLSTLSDGRAATTKPRMQTTLAYLVAVKRRAGSG